MGWQRGVFRFVLVAACIAAPGLSQDAKDEGGPTFTVSDLPVGRPLRIVVYGDMRFTNPSNTGDTHRGCANVWRKKSRK